MASNSPSNKSKEGVRSYFRRVSDKTKSFLKPSSKSASTSQQSLDLSNIGTGLSSHASNVDSRAKNRSSIHLSAPTPALAQQASASVPALPLTTSNISIPAIVETLVDPVVQTPETEGGHRSGATRKAFSGSWTGLELALKALGQSARVFPPLQSAIDTLIPCLEIVHGAFKQRDDCDELALELEGLATLLDKHLRESGTTSISDSVANVLQSIRMEIEYIDGMRNQGTARRIVDAAKDEDELLRCYRRVGALFRTLQVNISLSAWSIANEHLANSRLESLTPAKLASYNSTLATDIYRRACTPNTRTALLSEMNAWSHDPAAAKVYWMNGMAGTGKTTIACSLSKALEQRKQLGASFFCTRTSPECRSAKRIVPTIAYQLARYSRPFQSALCRMIEKDPDIATRQISLQFEHLLREPLVEVQGTMPNDVVVIIDALDECEDSQGVREILEPLFEYAPELPLRFFVTSRPEPEIWEKMQSVGDSARSILHLHEIEHSFVRADIELYLREELAFMSPSEEQIQQLTQRVGNLFIYAATAVRYIRPGNKRAADPRERLETVLAIKSELIKQHAELDTLYTTILEAVLNEEYLEPKEIERARRVLWTAVCVQEPVDVETLAALSEVREADALVVLQSLRSVLHISETRSLVSTLHASFPDFIFTQARAHKFFCDKKSHSRILAQRCFDVMKAELRFNICKLESSFVLDEAVGDLAERVDRYISRPLFYACRYWADHLSADVPADSERVMLDEFMSERLLFWMEVLNLRKAMAHGTLMVRRIQAWLLANNCDSDESCYLRVSDAENFVTIFSANPVSLSTPHIYISALPLFHKSIPSLKAYWERVQGLMDLDGTAVESRLFAPLASWGVSDWIDSIALSPNGRLIAYGGLRKHESSSSGQIGVLNRFDGQFTVSPFKAHALKANSVAFSPDSTRIVSGSNDKTICVWSANDGRAIMAPLEGHKRNVMSVVFSPDGARIASGSQDMTICVWDAYDGGLVAGPLKGHTGQVTSVAFSPDGTHLVSGSWDKTIRVWNTDDGKLLIPPLEGHSGYVMSVEFSPDNARIASGSADMSLYVWDAHGGKPLIGPLEGHTSIVTSVRFSPDGTCIASASADRTIRLWNGKNGNLIAGPFQGHTKPVTSVAFTPDGAHLVSGSQDKTICVWNAKNEKHVTSSFKGHSDYVRSIACSPNGACVASGSDDYTVCVWNSHDGKLVAGPFEGHSEFVTSVAFSPDGMRVVSGSHDKTICVWNVHDGKLAADPFEGHTDYVTSVAFSPNNASIASCSDDMTVCVWDACDGHLVAGPLRRHTGWVKSVAFSPDGTRIVSGSHDMTICVWSAHNGKLVTDPFKGHVSWVISVAFSPNGTQIISGSGDRTICVWNAQDGTLVAGPLTGHTKDVKSVAFSPDSSYIASASEDKTVCIWNAVNGRLVAGPFKGHTDEVNSVAFSPDSTQIVSCSSDCSIRITRFQEIPVPVPALDGEWELRSSGWVVNPDGQYLFWLPQSLHPSLPRLHESLAIGPQGSLKIDYSRIILFGSNWSDCYVGA